MASLIRYGTLSALCLLISSLSAKAGMFPLMAVVHAAAVPGIPAADMVPAEPDHHVPAHSVVHGGFDLAVGEIVWPAGCTRETSVGTPSADPVWLFSVSHKRATQFDLRS